MFCYFLYFFLKPWLLTVPNSIYFSYSQIYRIVDNDSAILQDMTQNNKKHTIDHISNLNDIFYLHTLFYVLLYVQKPFVHQLAVFWNAKQCSSPKIELFPCFKVLNSILKSSRVITKHPVYLKHFNYPVTTLLH